MNSTTNSHIQKIIGISLTVGLLVFPPQPAHAQATHIANDWAQNASGTTNDSLRDFLVRLRSALAIANKTAAQKHPVTFRANVTAEGRTGIRHLRIRNFQFLSDGAVNTGEYNLGPGSWPTLVGVLGSAVAQDYLIQAATKGIPLDSLEVIFTSTPGPAPSWTGRTITYPRALAYTANITSPASDAQLDELRQTVERESAVLNLIREKQDIPHAELIYTQTPADRGTELSGLRDFLEGKRAASRRPSSVTPPDSKSPVGGGGEALSQAERPRRRNRDAQVQDAIRGAQTGGANENAPLRADVKVEGSTGIRNIRTDDSNFQIIHDFPYYLGGHNLGPVAEEHTLGVMLTCLTHIFEIQAANRGVDLDSLRLEVDGTLSQGIGSTGQSPRFSNIRYRAYIASPKPQEAVAQLVEAVEGTCPIYNLLRNSNEVTGEVVRGPYKGLATHSGEIR